MRLMGRWLFQWVSVGHYMTHIPSHGHWATGSQWRVVRLRLRIPRRIYSALGLRSCTPAAQVFS